MSKRNWLNLALLILILVMTGAIYFRPGKEPEPSKPTLLAIRPSQVTTVHIEAGGGPKIRLKRTDQGWALDQPKQLPARQARLQAVWDLTSAKSQARVAPGGQGKGKQKDQAANYGLNDPYLAVQVDNQQIRVGSRHPFQRQRYVRVGDTIHLVKEQAVRAVKKGWTEYVSHSLVPEGRSLARIELPDATLKRASPGSWQTKGGAITAKEAGRMARAWQTQKAISVSKAPDKPKGTAKGVVTLHFQGTESSLRYRIWRSDSGLRLIRKDQAVAYKLLSASADGLIRPPAGKSGKGKAPQDRGKAAGTNTS